MRRDRYADDVGRVSIETAQTDIVVASRYLMTVTYAAGPRGVAVGGSVRFRLPGLDLRGTGQGPVSCSRDGVELICGNSVPGLGGKNGREFSTEEYLFVTVAGRALEPGDAVSVRYGQNITLRGQTAPLCAMPWRVEAAVDVDGRRAAPGSGFFLVPDAPVLNFVADRACLMEVTNPSSTVVKEAFAATVYLRDRYLNLATGYSGSVMLFAEASPKGKPVAERRAEVNDKGVIRFEGLTFDSEGIHRLWAVDEAAGIAGRSNATRTTGKAPATRVYWGETHCHSCFSADSGAINDRIATPAGDYRYARERSGLNFCMVTDHVEDLTDDEWARTQAAAAEAYEPGRFVTFSGYEATFKPSRRNGDKNVYFLTDDRPRIAEGDTAEWYARLKASGAPAMVIPHLHVPTNWSLHDPALERVVEVYAHWGCGLSPESVPKMVPGRDLPAGSYVSDALEAGARLGFVAGADHSWGHPGDDFWWWLSSFHGGLAAVRAGTLTRESVWEALWNRRCYATTRARILLEFEVNGHPMGEEFSSAGPRELKVGAFGTAGLDRVEIVRNNRLLEARRGPDSPDMEFTFLDAAPQRATDYYYVHVLQTDGEQAWSSPIWVTRKE